MTLRCSFHAEHAGAAEHLKRKTSDLFNNASQPLDEHIGRFLQSCLRHRSESRGGFSSQIHLAATFWRFHEMEEIVDKDLQCQEPPDPPTTPNDTSRWYAFKPRLTYTPKP
jgi:hypothetical protein